MVDKAPQQEPNKIRHKCPFNHLGNCSTKIFCSIVTAHIHYSTHRQSNSPLHIVHLFQKAIEETNDNIKLNFRKDCPKGTIYTSRCEIC